MFKNKQRNPSSKLEGKKKKKKRQIKRIKCGNYAAKSNEDYVRDLKCEPRINTDE